MCGADLIRLTVSERLAVLAHEEGHIALGHRRNPGLRTLEQEIAADLYATRKVGKAVNWQALARLDALIGTSAQRGEAETCSKALNRLESA